MKKEQKSGVLRDISERKQSEQALEESERRFRSMVDSSISGIFVFQDGKRQLVNDRLVEMSGYTREELFNLSFLGAACGPSAR